MTLRRLAPLFAVLAILAEPAFAQTQPIRRAVADLPTCASPTDGVMVVVLDPTGATDCSTGGGTASPHPCICDGAATTWTAISGGGGVSDHGGLTGLTDDDHPQYALLAGRSGGQGLVGGTAASESLRLSSTAHSTKGAVLVGDGASTTVLRFDNANTSNAQIDYNQDGILRIGALGQFQPQILLIGDAWATSPARQGEITFRYGPDGDLVFQLTDGVSTNSTVLRVTSGHNLGLRTTSFGSGTGVAAIGNAATRPSTAPADAVILSSEDAAAGAANLFAYNEAGQRVRLTGVDARVTADVNATTTTLANVPGLSFAVEAGKTYSFEARLLFTADATGGVKVGVGGTATATVVRWRTRISGDGNPPNEFANTQVSLGASTSHAGASVTLGLITVHGTVTVNAGGTLTIQFAQQSASGTSTINRGSTFHLQEIS